MYPLNPRSGVATGIALSPSSAQLAQGGNLQLTTNLSDALGNAVASTQPFAYSSSNSALATVDQNGLVSATAGDPTQLQTGGSVVITVQYPWGGAPNSGGTISASARLVITVPAATSVFVPQQGTTIAQASQNAEASGHSKGAGWKNIPAALEN